MFLITFVACNTNEPDNEVDNTPNAAETDTITTDTDPDTSTETTNEDAPNEDEATDATTITFAINGWERGLYENRIEAFEETHPDIKVELISTDDVFAGGGPAPGIEEDGLFQLVQRADVLSWYISQNSVRDGLLLNLAPLMEGDEDFTASDFFPNVLEQYQWDGGTWGIPLNVNYGLIFYDKDLFDTAGQPYPEAGWSWDDMLAAAQATTLREGDEVTQWGFSAQFLGPDLFIQALTGPLYDLSSDPPTARLDDPQTIEAFEWYAALYHEHEVAPYAPPPESEEDFANYNEIYQMIEEGKVAMWPEYAEAYTWRSEQRNIGVVPFPVKNSSDYTSPILSAGNILAISAGTEKAQAAWEWITFLTQQQEDNPFGPGGPTMLPSRRSVAEVSGVFDELDEELATAVRYAIDHGFTPIYPPLAGGEIYQAIESIINEERDVAEALAEAQQQFEEAAASGESEAAEATPVPEFTVAEPPSTQIDENDTVIKFVIAGGNPTIFRELAREYEEAHPDIVIQVTEPNFFNEDFTLAGVIGDADCFQWWSAIANEEDLEYVLSLQPFFDADPELSESDFFPVVLDQYRNQGQVIGLPIAVQVSLLSYNKRLFDAAEIDYPQPGWTIDEFLETAVALTSGETEEDKIYGFAPSVFEFNDLMIFMERQGATLINEDEDPPRMNFTDPQTISALRWYSNLGTEYEVKLTYDLSPFSGGFSGSSPFEDRNALIDNDRVAIWTSDQFDVVISRGPDGEIIEEEEDTSHIGYITYPVGQSGGSGFETTSGFYIAAQTEVRQPCWEWLKFLTSQESLVDFGLPARISTAQSPELAQRMGPDRVEMLITSVQNSTQPSFNSLLSQRANWMGPAVFWLQEAYEQVIGEDSLTVEEALQEAQDKADVYRQCIVENDALEANDYESWEPCLEEADPGMFDS